MADKKTAGSRRGFASMDQEKQREIASKGGQASGGNFANNRERASEAGKKGGQASGGNFAHNPERASQAGRKGGQASHGASEIPEDSKRNIDEGTTGSQAERGKTD